MKHFIPKDIVITDSNIAESEGISGTMYPYSLTDGYAIGVQRYYATRLWEVTDNVIHPLANYKWNNLDPLDNNGTNLHTQTPVADPTAVPVVINVTIVYVYSTKSYYKATVTGNVNFTTENWTTPTNFTDLGTTASYRYLYKTPEENSIYWKDLGATNRNKCADRAVNSQSTKVGTEMWFEFEAKNVDKVVLFNLEAESVKITVYTTAIGNPIYEDTITKLLDTTSIVDWRTLSQYDPFYVKNVDWTLPFFTGTVTIRITLLSTASSILALGEILNGQSKSVGVTLDGLPITIKSSGKIIEQDNGDIIFVDEGDVTKVYHIFNFSVKFESISLDTTLDLCDEMINRRIVVTAEDTDEIQHRSLVVYGFSRDVSPTFTAGNTKSNIKLQVQRFI